MKKIVIYIISCLACFIVGLNHEQMINKLYYIKNAYTIGETKSDSVINAGILKALKSNPNYNHKISLYDSLKDKSKNNLNPIIMLGDSITQNAEWNELIESTYVVNRGVGGDHTVGVLDRIDQLPKTDSYIFIMVGINDFLSGRKVESVLENYKLIIHNLKKNYSNIVIQSLLYTGGGKYIKFNSKIKKLNNLLQGLAKNEKVYYIDINKLLSTNQTLDSNYTYDGLHLKGKAYLLWAKEINTFLRKKNDKTTY